MHSFSRAKVYTDDATASSDEGTTSSPEAGGGFNAPRCTTSDFEPTAGSRAPVFEVWALPLPPAGTRALTFGARELPLLVSSAAAGLRALSFGEETVPRGLVTTAPEMSGEPVGDDADRATPSRRGEPIGDDAGPRAINERMMGKMRESWRKV